MKRPSSANDDHQSDLCDMAETCVMMRSRLVSRAISSIYDDKLRPFGLNASQCSLLVVIFGLGPARQAEIGRFNQLDRSTLSRNLKIMAQNGWIEEVDDDADGRGKPISLSKAGVVLLQAAHPAWREAQSRAKALLGSDGVKVISKLGDDLMGYRPG